MENRKAYILKAGNLANMQLRDTLLPPLKQGEVCIRIRAIGLNFADVFAIWGLYSATPKGEFIPGLEFAGEVIASKASDYAVGDKVMGVTRFGAYTTHINLDHRYVQALPPGWTFEEGAAFPVQVLTAYYGLITLGNLQKGSTVLIHSGAGGVGIWANRIAKRFKAFTIGTIGSKEKIPLLEKEGYDRWIVRGKHFDKQLTLALGERPLNLVMECIGGKILRIGYDHLAPQGRMIIYGSARYASPGNRPNYLRLLYYHLLRPRIDPQRMIESNKSIMGFNLIWLYERVELMHEILTGVNALDLGKPIVGHTFPFGKLPEAIRLFQTGKTTGKVVICIENDL